MISGSALKARGWAEGRLLGLAKKAGVALLAADPRGDKARVLDLLDAVRANPARYQGHLILRDLAAALVVAREKARPATVDELRAAPGVLGIIPGSMADPGYLVRGRGNPSALSSASHGAGRAMGRRVAIETISKAERDRYLAERRVTLLGGGMDEAPQAYKRIQDVIAAQDTLVEILGTFHPRIVRMAEESKDI